MTLENLTPDDPAARLATTGLAAATADSRVGAVVLTHNRAAEVVRTIERLLLLPEQPEIVVVDNASTDGTAELIRERFPTVQCLSLGTNLGGAGRNAGAWCCRRPYVALCDDDTWWGPGSLRRAADLLDQYSTLAIVTARVLVGPDDRLDPASALMSRSPVPPTAPLPGPALLGFLAGASLVRRSAFLAAGGFECRLFVGGEEELMALDLAAAGWQIAYADEVVVHHYPSPSRSPTDRQYVVARNQLWVTWLRRPWPVIARRALRAAGRASRDPVARRALFAALRGLPWVVRRRWVVPPLVERHLRLLERSDGER